MQLPRFANSTRMTTVGWIDRKCVPTSRGCGRAWARCEADLAMADPRVTVDLGTVDLATVDLATVDLATVSGVTALR